MKKSNTKDPYPHTSKGGKKNSYPQVHIDMTRDEHERVVQ